MTELAVWILFAIYAEVPAQPQRASLMIGFYNSPEQCDKLRAFSANGWNLRMPKADLICVKGTMTLDQPVK